MMHLSICYYMLHFSSKCTHFLIDIMLLRTKKDTPAIVEQQTEQEEQYQCHAS